MTGGSTRRTDGTDGADGIDETDETDKDGDVRPDSPLRRLAAAVKKPEHTDENRCLPCTLVNTVVVALVAGVLSRRRRPLGFLAALLGGAAIWLRGYAIPGTPRFAPRLVDPLPIDIGPDHPDDLGSGSVSVAGPNSLDGDRSDMTDVTDATDTTDADSDTDARNGSADRSGPDGDRTAVDSDGVGDEDAADPEAVMLALLDADALVDDGETLALDESFRAALYDRTGSLREESDAALADRAAAIAGPAVDGEAHDGRILLAGSRDAWLSRPIALAETAAAELLRERDVDDGVARAAARPLRAFLDTCPVCEGPVRETTLRDCCGGPGGVSGNPERPVRACADCDAIVFADRS